MDDDLDELDLHAFLDGQLDPRQEAAVLARLAADAGLRERVSAYAEQNLALKLAQADGLVPRQPLPGSASALAWRLREQVRRHRYLRVAAAVLLFVMGWSARDLHDGLFSPRLPGYARDAVADHEVFAEARRPTIEVAADDSDQLERMLVAQLGRHMEVPELRSMGLRLIGARRTGTEDGPGSQFIYEDRQGKRITLLVAPSIDEPDEESIALTEMEGYVVGYWRGHAFGYALIGRETPDNLLQVAAAIGTPVRE